MDSLYRLAGQVKAYGMVLDQVTLVTTSRHLEEALSLVPFWWGVMVAQYDGDDIVLNHHRVTSDNPHLDPLALVQLLWRDEALAELRTRGWAQGLSRAARHHVLLRTAAWVNDDELRDLVRERLKARYARLDAQPHAQSDENLPTPPNSWNSLM